MTPSNGNISPTSFAALIKAARSTPAYRRIAALAVLVIAGAIAFELPGALANAGSEDFLPHGFCFLWNPGLVTLHVASDSTIFFSYMAISLSLAWLVYREREKIPMGWMVGAFGLFIVACGFTHAMDILVLWKPLYWLSGDVKLVTAIASITTAALLPLVMPRIRQLLAQAEVARQNERRFLAASDSSNDAFYILESVRDAEGEIVDFRFVFVNAHGARLISNQPETLRGRLLCETYPSERANGMFATYKRVVETGELFEAELAVTSSVVNAAWLHYKVLKLEDGVATTASDISVRKENEIKLARYASFARSIVASSPLATIVTDLHGTITSLNGAAERMLLYDKDDLIGRATPLVFFDPQEVKRRSEELSRELRAHVEPDIGILAAKPSRGLAEESEWRFVRRDGTSFDALLSVSALSGATGDSDGLVLVAHDITERKRNDERNAYLALHDALTGLPTRVLLNERLAAALARPPEEARRVAVLMVDLDDFKSVNDHLGHHAGDELLVGVARRLSGAVGERDTVARIGGDEFVVMLDDIEDARALDAAAERVLRALAAPIELEAQVLLVTASIGACLFDSEIGSAEHLLRYADKAMYRSKAKGGGGYEAHSATANTERFARRGGDRP
jgi:diguanylate cyclase (GGDEF)-like protein/PAS domain S-box-containing protein